jgi:hypothetical protein
MEDFLQRVLLFVIGAILVGGGLTFTFQSMQGQRAAFQGALFGMVWIVIGLYFFAWTFMGPPG